MPLLNTWHRDHSFLKTPYIYGDDDVRHFSRSEQGWMEKGRYVLRLWNLTIELMEFDNSVGLWDIWLCHQNGFCFCAGRLFTAIETVLFPWTLFPVEIGIFHPFWCNPVTACRPSYDLICHLKRIHTWMQLVSNDNQRKLSFSLFQRWRGDTRVSPVLFVM